MMLLEPFFYDFVADHQRTLRAAAERAGREGRPGRWRVPLGMPATVESRRVPPIAWRRLSCRRLLACPHGSGHAFVGRDA